LNEIDNEEAVAMAILMNKEQIMEILPHRDPFLLIDEIIGLMPGEQVVARKHLREDEYWFKGHFPGYPVQPGVLMIEMLAQAGGVCILSVAEHKGKLAFLAGVDKARFKRKVMPGDTLILEVKLVKMRGNIGVAKAVASVEGEKAVTCDITFALSDETLDAGSAPVEIPQTDFE